MKQLLFSAMLVSGLYCANAQTAPSSGASQSTSGCISNASQSFLPNEGLEIITTTTQSNGIVSWGSSSGHRTTVASFVIERSFDGRNFTALQSLAVKSSGDYNFTDAGVWNIAPDRVWYRLQIVNNDGSSTYSPVVELTGRP